METELNLIRAAKSKSLSSYGGERMEDDEQEKFLGIDGKDFTFADVDNAVYWEEYSVEQSKLGGEDFVQFVDVLQG